MQSLKASDQDTVPSTTEKSNDSSFASFSQKVLESARGCRFLINLNTLAYHREMRV